MKLSIFLFTLIFITTYNECESKSWFPNIYETVANQTTQFTDHVRDKGRKIKIFYNDHVKSPIVSYYGSNPEKQRNVEDVNENSITTEGDYGCPDPADDPRLKMNTLQLIASYGYRAEAHTVVTKDGYILTLHRISSPRNSTFGLSPPRRTVLLHHGLLGSSADWVYPGPKKALAFILSDHGYDVWMANVRGNTYSRAHVSLNADSAAFWNFTFHEVSQYDLPAIIDYIKEVKGGYMKINYIGHSMGTTVLFALLSTKTEYNQILGSGIALAPVAYMTDIKSPIHLLAPYVKTIASLLNLLGANEFLPQTTVLKWLSKNACTINNYEKAFCENAIFVLCGYDPKEFNRTLLPMILAHGPAGASTKTLVHYAQEINNYGNFQMFDYGPEGNKIQYGDVTPPHYPVEKISLPIAMLSAQNDGLSSIIDARTLFNKLQAPIEHYIVPLKEFNHVDFLWANDAPTLVYDKVLELLARREDLTNVI